MPTPSPTVTSHSPGSKGPSSSRYSQPLSGSMRDFTVASGAFSGSGVASTPGVGEGCSADCPLSPAFTTLSGFTVSTVVSGLGAESRSSATPSPMPISATAAAANASRARRLRRLSCR